MENLQIFKNENFGKIRVLLIDNETWFVGKDVVSILGYKNGSRDINRHVDEDDRQNYQNGTLESNRGLTIINESGLYSLILCSKLPKAKEFKRWVTNEVLPSIRKHGGYLTSQKIEEILNDPRNFIKTLEAYAEEKEKNKILQLENNELKEENKEMQPKANYYDKLIDKELLLNFRDSAKELGIKQKEFINILLDKKILYRDGNKRLRPYSQYISKGYFGIKEGVGGGISYSQTFITVKGREYLIRLLDKIKKF